MSSTKMNPKLNVRLLRKVQNHIASEPRRFKMSFYVDRRHRERQGELSPPCNTTACIAVWALLLSGKKIRASVDYQAMAAKLLGLTYDLSRRVFHVEQWPAQFRRRYNKDVDKWPDWYDAKPPTLHALKRNAAVAVSRIEHLIKTGM